MIYSCCFVHFVLSTKNRNSLVFLFSFQEQLARAAAAKQLKVEQKLMEDQARQEMEERMKAAKGGGVVGGT